MNKTIYDNKEYADDSIDETILLNNIWVSYNGESVLKNISLSIPKRTIQIIIGPSGAGKTTLLKVINGLLLPKKGSIKILGQDISSGNNHGQLRRQIGYIPQNLGLVNSMTVRENVMMGALSRISTLKSLFKIFPEEEINLALHLIKVVGLSSKVDKKIFNLSGGEKRRVAIARAFMQKPKILLADEILSDLDFIKVKTITDKIRALKEEFGVTVVMVEHDLHIARNFGEKIMILREGEIKGNFLSEEINDKLLHEAFSS